MITIENNLGYKKNECFIILDHNNNVVDVPTFKNNRRKSYHYNRYGSCNPQNIESQFNDINDAEKILAKCKRNGTIAKIAFDDIDISLCYNGNGANILGYDFVNERIWIESKDKEKYGYQYHNLTIIEHYKNK